MPRRVVSFKPTAECEVQLAELMGRWKGDRTSTLIMAVDVAHKALVIGTMPPKAVHMHEEKQDMPFVEVVPVGTTTGVAEPKVLPKDPKAVAKVASDLPSKPVLDEKSKAMRRQVDSVKLAKPTDTRSQQERMDDFYRANMAKGKK